MPALASGSSCTFTLQVKVPLTALPITYTNTTSVITADGGITGDAASAQLGIVLGSRPPIANAGIYTPFECTGNGSADVMLDGSGSVSNIGQVLAYTWYEDGQIIATGQKPTVSLDLGMHNITLVVEDDAGSGMDDVVITVVDQTDPEITCPDGTGTSFTLFADQNCEAVLPDYTLESLASDNCSSNVSVTQTPAPGTVLTGHGMTQVLTLTAR